MKQILRLLLLVAFITSAGMVTTSVSYAAEKQSTEAECEGEDCSDEDEDEDEEECD